MIRIRIRKENVVEKIDEKPSIATIPQVKSDVNETEIKFESIAIPDIKSEVKRIELEESEKVEMRYPLSQFSSVYIFFDTKKGEMTYNVEEPKLEEVDRILIEEIKEYVQEKVDINFSQIRKKDAISHIEKFFDRALDYFKARFDSKKREIYKYYIFRDFIGLGKIEALMNDKQIEDISCDGVGIPIYVYHRNPRIGSMKTNIVFNDKEELDSFVNKLAERCGKNISVSRPLLDGTLPDGSRVQATLGSDIARRGSNFTIRMFTEKPMTPVDIVEFGTCDVKMMAYYWFLIEHGASILVSGGTATGKTSFLNVLSLFIKPQMKIVSIEDTAELRLPHSHWVPEVARTPIGEEGKVDLFELLKESLRQRPDYIIVGEVRGKEAYVLFQQIAVGHPGLSTIHSENFTKLVDRLTTPPISLPANLLENLDAIIFLNLLKHGRKYMRRTNSSFEVIGYDSRSGKPIAKEVFRWNPRNDSFEIVNNSFLLKKIADKIGYSEKDVREEFKKRVKVIEWMIKHEIKDYQKIGAIINLFYTSQDYLIEKIEAGV